MPLIIAPKSTVLIIQKVLGKDKVLSHLRSLGIIEGREIIVLEQNGSAVIVKVGDMRLALDRHVASAIQVAI
jgi:Fe2+ transport system protein FeoA